MGTITANVPWYYQVGMVLIAIPAILTVGYLWLDKRVLKIFHGEDADQRRWPTLRRI